MRRSFERRLVETSSALRLEMAGLRQEMRDGFAAVRLEMHDGFAFLRREMQGDVTGLRQEMDGRLGAVGQEFAALRHEIAMRHAELLKWSFLFWIGQVAVVAGLFGVLLRVIL